MNSPSLIIRNVEVEGRAQQDVHIVDGRIADVGPRLSCSGRELDGAGGALIPGLIDHHVHLLAAAAQVYSVPLDAIRDPTDLERQLRLAIAARPRGAWVRAVGYHEGVAGVLTRDQIDRFAPDHPVRVQHRGGALWMLNSLALDKVLGGADAPPCVERDADGRPTGRIWRGDAWLSDRIGRVTPPLEPIGRRLAAFGVTGVTDASATTDADAARTIGEARLPQKLMLMSAGPLDSAPGIAVGPVKILLDEHDLPDLEEMAARIRRARAWHRCVAVHCVTVTELAWTLAAFEIAGAQAGDRIEHGGLIPEGAFGRIKAMGLTLVTQPGFVFAQGDRYLAEVPAEDHLDLYRCASLLRAGVPVAASSDAPYGALDPWDSMRAAVNRRTRAGEPLGPGEAVNPATALSLYLGDFHRPGGPSRRVTPGKPADLCLLAVPLRDALAHLDAELVAATLIGGELVYDRGASASAPMLERAAPELVEVL